MFRAQRACTDSEIIGFHVLVGRCSRACFGVTGSRIAKRCNYFMKTRDAVRQRERGREKKKRSIYRLILPLSNSIVLCQPFIHQSPQSITEGLRDTWHHILNKSHTKYTDTLRTSALNVSHTPLFLRRRFLIGRKTQSLDISPLRSHV